MAIVQCVREKRDRNIFRNILYKTRAIFMKFGTWLTQKFKLGQKGEYLQITNSNHRDVNYLGLLPVVSLHTKFEVCIFSHSRDIDGVPKLKM